MVRPQSSRAAQATPASLRALASAGGRVAGFDGNIGCESITARYLPKQRRNF